MNSWRWDGAHHRTDGEVAVEAFTTSRGSGTGLKAVGWRGREALEALRAGLLTNPRSMALTGRSDGSDWPTSLNDQLLLDPLTCPTSK